VSHILSWNIHVHHVKRTRNSTLIITLASVNRINSQIWILMTTRSGKTMQQRSDEDSWCHKTEVITDWSVAWSAADCHSWSYHTTLILRSLHWLKTRHRASTSMYSLTFLRSYYVGRTPPVEARSPGRRSNVENAPRLDGAPALLPQKLGRPQF